MPNLFQHPSVIRHTLCLTTFVMLNLFQHPIHAASTLKKEILDQVQNDDLTQTDTH